MKKNFLFYLSVILMLAFIPSTVFAAPECTAEDYCDSILKISDQSANIPFTGDASWMGVANQLFNVEVKYSDGLEIAVDPAPALIYSCSLDGYKFDNCADVPFTNVGAYTLRATAAESDSLFYLESYADSTLTITDAADVDLDGLTVTYHSNLTDSGAAVEDSDAYAFGDEVTILGNLGLDETGNPNPLAKAGYTFNSWNSAETLDGTSYSFGDLIHITNDLNLYPEWKSIQADGTVADAPITVPAVETVTAIDETGQPLESKTAVDNDKFKLGEGWFALNESAVLAPQSETVSKQVEFPAESHNDKFMIGDGWYVVGDVTFDYQENMPAANQQPIQQPVVEEPEAILEFEPEAVVQESVVIEDADIAIVPEPVAELPVEPAPEEAPLAEDTPLAAAPAEAEVPAIEPIVEADAPVTPIEEPGEVEIDAAIAEVIEEPAEALPQTVEELPQPEVIIIPDETIDPASTSAETADLLPVSVEPVSKGLDEGYVEKATAAQAAGIEFTTVPTFENDSCALDGCKDKLPETGFHSALVTPLREQPASLSYTDLYYELDLPQLQITSDIVTVPFENTSWAVEWLHDRAGLLEGSALPGQGISYIAGHNHLNTAESGPFLFIGNLKQNDRIFVRDPNGELLEFSVVANELYEPNDFALVQAKASEYNNPIVLITCENEAPDGHYLNRRIVFAKQL